MGNVRAAILFVFSCLAMTSIALGLETQYRYDDLGRLEEVRSGEILTTYNYDAADNRLLKSVQRIDVTPPTLPGGLNVSQVNSNTVNVSWSAAIDDTGVEKYTIRHVSASGYSSWQDVFGVQTQISSLNVGATYSFQVRAHDSAGNVGGTVSKSHLMNDLDPPSRVAIQSKSQVDSRTLRVVLLPSTDNVGVVGYRYRYSESSTLSTWSSLLTSTTISIANLTPGKTYTLYFKAFDSAGNGGEEFSVTHLMQDIVPPSPPANLAITQASSNVMSMAWTASSDDVGVRGYKYKGANGVWSSEIVTTNVSISGVVVGTEYTIQVVSVDTSGNVSAPSTISYRVKDLDQPKLLGEISVSLITATQATVSWPQATDDIGIQRYQYRINGGVWASTYLSTSVIVRGSQNSVQTIEVVAVDTSQIMSASLTKTFKLLPYPPLALRVSGIGLNSATVSWDLPVNSDHVAGFQYSLNQSNWTTISGHNTLLTGLSSGANYTVYVRTLDTYGQFSNSISTTFTTASPVVPSSITLANASIYKHSSGAASYQLTNSGLIMGSSQTLNALVNLGQWINPVSGVSNFEARATNLGSPSTCLNQSRIGTWINLNSSPTWSQPGYYVTMTCRLLIEIRAVANPNHMLSSATISLTGKQ